MTSMQAMNVGLTGLPHAAIDEWRVTLVTLE
jgi:hypothetical protein